MPCCLRNSSVFRQRAYESCQVSVWLVGEGGWRAAAPGEQTIRLLFDEPQRLRRIHVRFEERERARAHEFALGWSPDPAAPPREIVRQQYSFDPQGATVEEESYDVDLAGVAVLQLRIRPDTAGSDALASLARLRLA